MRIEFERLEPRHAEIVPYLRQADVDELRDGPGVSATWAVAYFIACSRPGFAARVSDSTAPGHAQRAARSPAGTTPITGPGPPALVFGIGPGLEKGLGVPWLLATEEVERHPVTFYRESGKLFPTVAAGYERLVNWVDARNTLSLRWLEWLGFGKGPPVPFGVRGLEFHRMSWER